MPYGRNSSNENVPNMFCNLLDMKKLIHLFVDESGAIDMNHDDRARFLKFMNVGELAQKHVDKLLNDNIKLSKICDVVDASKARVLQKLS